MSWVWMASSALAICEVRRSAASEVMPSRARAASVPPERNSIAMNGRSPEKPWS